MVFAASGSAAAKDGIQTSSSTDDTTPSEPFEPSEPYEYYFPKISFKKVLDRVKSEGYDIHIFRQPNELKQAMNETKGLLS